ncbi:ABC transporter substrate-binding protein [Paenibacillus sp. HW567]|uniref:ABC transporter substrate-binding protein n=1 Tax=Paenibacillus sp. HW567 TaxID=1034769 RepID=UPI00037A6A37|nr:ABC transporter substrate-binding protein [Paenibacillus sp. HW567]
MSTKSLHWIGWFTALALMVVLTACSVNNASKQSLSDTKVKETQTPQTRTYKDQFGEVTIPQEPKKLLVIGTRYAEYLISMGIKPAMVAGVPSVEPEYRSEYFKENGVQLIDYPQYEQNYELLLSLAPDMIVAMGFGMEQDVYEHLSQIAPTVAISSGPSMDEAMPVLAELFGKQAEYKRVKAEFDSTVEKAKLALDKAIGDHTVLVLRADQKNYRVLGQRAKMGSSQLFYHQLGLKIPEQLAKEEAWFTVISMELLPEMNPDYIFVENRQAANFNGDETTKELKKSNIWNGLKAVKEGKVFTLDTRDFVGGEGPIGYPKLIDYIVSSLIPEGSK